MPHATIDPPAPPVLRTLSADDVAFFHREGYFIARGLLGRDEAQSLMDHFMSMHADGTMKNYTYADEATVAEGDPLKIYPRVMHPHRWDERSLRYLLDARVAGVLRQLLGEEPVATQSMMYFKPPGARGQALHQDNYYLRVRPQTCIAGWMALEDCDPENGGLQVVPGTHTLDVACPEKADNAESFSNDFVRPPEGMTPVPANLHAGDVLFFNGSVIHGSTPNNSATRWRRSYICHYAPASMQEISQYYFPILDMDGREVRYEGATGGGPCGREEARYE